MKLLFNADFRGAVSLCFKTSIERTQNIEQNSKNPNMKPKLEKRPYEVTLLKGHGSLRSVLKAINRKKAVARAQVKFREQYGDTLGPAHKIMTVTDPYYEVVYDDDFKCSDGLNRLLPKDVIKRVIADSNGELVRETDRNKGVSLKRLKRKKQYGSRSLEKATGIRSNNKGDLFYRAVLVPVRERGGVIVQKKEVKDYRLKARNLHDAIAEIKKRKLKRKKKVTVHSPKPPLLVAKKVSKPAPKPKPTLLVVKKVTKPAPMPKVIISPVKKVSKPVPKPEAAAAKPFKLTDAAAMLIGKLDKPKTLADGLASYFGQSKDQLAARLKFLKKNSSYKKPKA